MDIYHLTNDDGIRVSILTFGGIIVTLEVPDRTGRLANVVLGLASLDSYAHVSPHFGAVVGRFANRIVGGRFAIDGTTYQLEINNGPNALHGGREGFDKVVWQASVGAGESLTLSYLSRDGEEGYRGNLAVQVIYSLGATNELRMDYEAWTDKPTIVNLTNHSYFNLAGKGSGYVLDHVVSIDADFFTPTDATRIPTGEIRSVRGTPLDFTAPRAVGERIRFADEQLQLARGYDHNWALRRTAGGGLLKAARAFEPKSGRTLDVLTDRPGLQFYTGNSLNDALVGPAGRAYGQSDGLCFETQVFPDSPNQSAFPRAGSRPDLSLQHSVSFFYQCWSATSSRAKRYGCSLKGASWSPAHGAQHCPCGTLNVAGAPKEAACVTPSKGLDGSRITRLSATARRRR